MSQGPVTAAVASNVRALSAKRKMTHEDVAVAMTKAGVPMKRHTIASICGGRRTEVSVEEATAFAKVFDVDLYDMVDA
jgi:hypothetical protein